MIEKDDITKDSITLVTDENQPNLRLPDVEMGEAIKRLCKNEDIKEALHEAVKNHKNMTRKPWKDHVIHGVITITGIGVTVLIVHTLSATPTL